MVEPKESYGEGLAERKRESYGPGSDYRRSAFFSHVTNQQQLLAGGVL